MGNIYVTGGTNSSESRLRPFPISSEAFQTIYGGGLFDAFVVKFNPNGSLAYSTFLGGSEEERGTSIALDASSNAYVTGFSGSLNFPTVNAVQAVKGDSERIFYDVFVTKLNPSGSALVYSTYLGGSGDDSGAGVVVDAMGAAYVTGATDSPNFPSVNAFQPVRGGGSLIDDAFVAKITDDAAPTEADLAVALVDAPDPVTVGNNLTYTLTVTNNGPNDATGVTLTDTLPTGVSFGSVASSQGTCSRIDTVSCNLGSLMNGATATVTLVVTPTTAGPLTNTASVSGNETDPTTSNNTASATTTVMTPPPPPPAAGPDLTGSWVSLTQTCKTVRGVQRCTLTGSFVVRNRGNRPAPPSTLRLFLSTNKRFEPAQDQRLKSLAVGALQPKQKQPRTVTIALPAGSRATGKFVLAVVDATNVVTETNENNNVIVFGSLP